MAAPKGAAPGRDTYSDKRHFEDTPEPASAGRANVDLARARPGKTFVIHQHHARRLHFDLRLEMLSGSQPVLASWAIPKGLPLRDHKPRLAVHVEDHPIEYGSFSGTIPKGNYGAGEVRIFDSGAYELLEQDEGKLSFRLQGNRIRGVFHLARAGRDGSDQWFATLKEDERPPAEPPPALDPMLATPRPEPFDDPGWMFEPKWDGVRTLAFIEGERTALRSRRGREVEGLYPELSEMAVQLSGFNGLIDGEIVGLDEKGHPSFERIQQRFTLAKPTQQAMTRYPVEYVAFDLLWLDGESLLDRPLEERRALLERHVVPGKHVQVSPQFEERGVAFFEAAKAQGFEGLIAKKKGTIYRPGQRSKDWLKIKFIKEQDCVIVGWVPGEKGRAGQIGSLLAAVYEDGGLVYAGHVGTGFTAQTLRLLKEKLEPLAQPEPPLPPPPRDEVDPRTARWVRPELICSVEYLQFTTQGRMRAASFKGLRDDKVPEDCVREES
jgi:bifunctional non-homologous end joining protein LigD